MKTLVSYLVLAVAAITLLTGCAPAIQAGIALTGSFAASAYEAKKPEQKGVLKKQSEPVQVNELITETSIGSNIVKINRGWYQETFSIVFSVVDKDGKLTERIHKVVPIEKYSDEIARIKSMDDGQKKAYVRSNLLAQNIDLDAREVPSNELTETRPIGIVPREPQAPSAPQAPRPGDITVPGFAPTPSKPR